MFQRRLKARRYSFRVQQFGASSSKPRRVKLIAAKRVWAKGKMVTAGTDVTQNGLSVQISKPKIATVGKRIRGAE